MHRALLNKKKGKKGTEEKMTGKGNPPNHHTVHRLEHRASTA